MSDDELKASILNLNRRTGRLERLLDVVAIVAVAVLGYWLIS